MAYGYGADSFRGRVDFYVHKRCKKKFESRFTSHRDLPDRTFWTGPYCGVHYHPGAETMGLKGRICSVCQKGFTSKDYPKIPREQKD